MINAFSLLFSLTIFPLVLFFSSFANSQTKVPSVSKTGQYHLQKRGNITAPSAALKTNFQPLMNLEQINQTLFELEKSEAQFLPLIRSLSCNDLDSSTPAIRKKLNSIRLNVAASKRFFNIIQSQLDIQFEKIRAPTAKIEFKKYWKSKGFFDGINSHWTNGDPSPTLNRINAEFTEILQEIAKNNDPIKSIDLKKRQAELFCVIAKQSALEIETLVSRGRNPFSMDNFQNLRNLFYNDKDNPDLKLPSVIISYVCNSQSDSQSILNGIDPCYLQKEITQFDYLKALEKASPKNRSEETNPEDETESSPFGSYGFGIVGTPLQSGSGSNTHLPQYQFNSPPGLQSPRNQPPGTHRQSTPAAKD
jgi:hypothetical protein